VEYVFKMKRLTWQQYALEIAKVASLRSEDPYMQVGACALDYDNRVIGVAYNGLAQGKEVNEAFWEDRDARRPFMIHAEANLLSLFERNKCKILACTLLPCSSCATLIASHGIKQVIYRENYNRDEAAKEIFKFYNIDLIQLL